MDPKLFVSNYERPYFYNPPLLPPPPPPPPATGGHKSHAFNLNDNVSPTVLLIIIILAIIFFISGLLHLLIRYLMRPINYRDPDELFDDVSVLQGQLQQLFHLHDSGVDQSFIDTLPVFSYKSVVGVKLDYPFDCAVCLCEFEGEDKLRLLPKCSHAFHMDCIDTWLLSHSTCPLCRGSLICERTHNTCFTPIVLVLESGSGEVSRNSPNCPSGSTGSSNTIFESDKGEMVKEDDGDKEEVVRIKLGKFKSVDGGGVGEGSSEKQTIDGRGCFSMGSFEYVMNESSSLQVPIRTQVKKQLITSSHRAAVSECGGDSRRDFKGIEIIGGGGGGAIGKEKPTLTAIIGPSKRESFSFRFPVRQSELKANRRANSELGVRRWEDGQEIQVCQWMDSVTLEVSNTPSFARRTLLWVMGRQQIKEVHSSSSTNV